MPGMQHDRLLAALLHQNEATCQDHHTVSWILLCWRQLRADCSHPTGMQRSLAGLPCTCRPMPGAAADTTRHRSVRHQTQTKETTTRLRHMRLPHHSTKVLNPPAASCNAYKPQCMLRCKEHIQTTTATHKVQSTAARLRCFRPPPVLLSVPAAAA